MAIPVGSENGTRTVRPKKRRERTAGESAARQLFAYYSPTGRPQPKGLLKKVSSILDAMPPSVVSSLVKNRGKIVFVNEQDVEERQPIPKGIQKLIGGMDLGILGDIANMYAPRAAIDSRRPMIFLSTNPTKGLKYVGPKGIGTVARHELGHSASNDLYLRRTLALLYRGSERKMPGMMSGQREAVANRRDQEVMGPGFSPTLGHNDRTFPAAKFEWPDRWGDELKDSPDEWVNEEKWAESFAYYTDKKWRKLLHPEVQQYFRDTLGE